MGGTKLIRNKHWFSMCFGVLFYVSSYAQYPGSAFELYSSRNGIPDNNIQCISQDRKGFIWIGTESGLSRFDGMLFTSFISHDKPFFLPGLNIEKIIPFSNNRFALITRQGFTVIDPLQFSGKQYLLPDTTVFSLYLNYVRDAAELPGGGVLLSTSTGLYEFNQEGDIAFRYDHYYPADVKQKRILYGRSIIPLNKQQYLVYCENTELDIYDTRKKINRHISRDETEWNIFRSNNIWLNTRCKKINSNEFILFDIASDTIIYYDREKNKKVFSALPFRAEEEFNWTSDIFLLGNNQFAINCKKNGYYLFTLDVSTGRIVCTPQKYLEAYKCNYLFRDRDERLWVCTRTGLLKQRINAPFLTTSRISLPRQQNPAKIKFNCVFRYRDKFYFGSENDSAGLVTVDTATMQVLATKTFIKHDQKINSIYSIHAYYKDTLWLGTSDGVWWYDTKTMSAGRVKDEHGKPVFFTKTTLLYKPDRYGNVWLCSVLGGEVAQYNLLSRQFRFFGEDTRPALPFNWVKNIVYDAYGDTWLSGHALAKWNNKAGLFDTLITVYDGPFKFTDDILVIAADKHGSLWLHNAGNGLLEYRILEKKFRYYDGIKYGLTSTTLQSMAEQVDDKLWFTTGTRLGCFDIKKQNAVTFGQLDGVPGERSSSRTIFFDSAINTYYSLHDNYLVSFRSSLPAEKLLPDQIQFTQLLLNDRTIYYPQSVIELPYRQNNFQLDFTVIDYENTGGYKFAYQINDEQWVEIGNQRKINFSSLQPGKLNIRLRVTGNYGQELEKELSVYIKYPFWLKWWFVALIAALISGLLYSLYRYRLGQLKKLFRVRSKISQDLHDEVGATLSGLSMYSHLTKEQVKAGKREDVERSLTIMQQSAAEMVNKLNDIVWSVNPHHDSLIKLLDKLEEYATEMAATKNMKTNVHIPPGRTAHIKLPMETRKNIYLFCKEAINNAVKYSNATLLELIVKEIDGNLEFSVNDNGKGFDASLVRRGNGLENMQKRADEIGAKLVLQTKENEGTSVCLQCKIT